MLIKIKFFSIKKLQGVEQIDKRFGYHLGDKTTQNSLQKLPKSNETSPKRHTSMTKGQKFFRSIKNLSSCLPKKKYTNIKIRSKKV